MAAFRLQAAAYRAATAMLQSLDATPPARPEGLLGEVLCLLEPPAANGTPLHCRDLYRVSTDVLPAQLPANAVVLQARRSGARKGRRCRWGSRE